jgi:hypothetical protein
MDTRSELQQALWEVIAEMERARLQGDDNQALRLELYVPLDTRGYLPLSRSGTKITPS